MQMFETGKPVYANDRFRRLDGFLCATVKKLIFFSTKFPCSRGERIRFPADYQSDCNRFLAETRRIDGDHRLTESSFRIRGKWKKGEKREGKRKIIGSLSKQIIYGTHADNVTIVIKGG